MSESDSRLFWSNAGAHIVWKLPDAKRVEVDLTFAADGSLVDASVRGTIDTSECRTLGPTPLLQRGQSTDDAYTHITYLTPNRRAMYQEDIGDAPTRYSCAWWGASDSSGFPS